LSIEVRSEHSNEASIADVLEVAEEVSAVGSTSARNAAPEVDLVDPSDIEIIEDGITFLDVQDRSTAPPSSRSAVVPETPDDEEDTGITFLD
jgi:hypothetical protein